MKDRQLSTKALRGLSDNLDSIHNRFEALQKQVATLHIHGGGVASTAYHVGQAQALALGIQRDLDRLSNAVYQLVLLAEQLQNERDRATQAEEARKLHPQPVQPKDEAARTKLEAARPGPSNVRDKLATKAVDQPRPDHPLV